MPARAAWAATELARLPVDAHAATLNPSSRARARATETTRSLNEAVGVRVSFLLQDRPRPSPAGIRTWCRLPTGCRGLIGPLPPPLWMLGLHDTSRSEDFQSAAPDSRSEGLVCLALAPTCRRPQSARSTIASSRSTAWSTPRA